MSKDYLDVSFEILKKIEEGIEETDSDEVKAIFVAVSAILPTLAAIADRVSDLHYEIVRLNEKIGQRK